MASPFTVFRKNQKVLLAVTGILAMIAFVFLGTCTQTSRPVQAYENPAIVSWKFGDIRAYDMDGRRSMRRILNSFLVQSARAAGVPLEPIFGETEESVVASMVLAQRGRDLGLMVGDDVVNRFIAQITNNRLRPADLESIIATFSVGGQRVTPKTMFDALREELLANQTAMLFRDGLGVGGHGGVPSLDTPAQRWDYFRRFEQRMKAQVLPVPVAEFTEAKEIGKPTETELEKLFETHKHEFALPSSPEPGFRQPYRARFQYFKAGVEDLVTAEMENVSEEEIKEYYEKNKDTQFRQSKLPPIEKPETKSSADEAAKTGEDAAKKDDSAKEDDSSAPKTGDGKESQPDKPKADETKADETQSDNATKKESESTAGKSGKAQPDASNASEVNDQEGGAANPPAKDGTPPEKSAQARNSRFQVVKYQANQSKKGAEKGAAKPNDAKKPSGDGSGAKDSKAKDATKASPSATSANAGTKQEATKADTATEDSAAKDEAGKEAKSDKKSESTASDTAKTTEPVGTAAKEEAKKDGAAKADERVETEDANKETADAKPEPVQYKPLEEVRNTIRRAIASQRAQDQVEKKFAPLRNAMIRYTELRTRWQIEATTNPDEPQPKPIDIEALAREHGVKAYNTEFLSRLDVDGRVDLEIAKSRDMNTRSPNFFQFWADIVFQPKGLYRPLTTVVPGGGDSFLSWKIDEREGHVPQFKDVREDVVEAWKRIQARDLAKKNAEEYAKSVRDARQPMQEVFSKDENLPVKEVGPFSWLTRPSVPFGMMQQTPPPEMSKVPGVESPGDEFMQAAFNLKAGDVAVAFNEPKTVVYVIQAVEFDPLESVLQREYLVLMKNYDRYRAAAGIELARAQNLWMQSLYDEYQVEWHRAADAPVEEVE